MALLEHLHRPLAQPFELGAVGDVDAMSVRLSMLPWSSVNT
jgi:hypothetical protein